MSRVRTERLAVCYEAYSALKEDSLIRLIAGHGSDFAQLLQYLRRAMRFLRLSTPIQGAKTNGTQ